MGWACTPHIIINVPIHRGGMFDVSHLAGWTDVENRWVELRFSKICLSHEYYIHIYSYKKKFRHCRSRQWITPIDTFLPASRWFTNYIYKYVEELYNTIVIIVFMVLRYLVHLSIIYSYNMRIVNISYWFITIMWRIVPGFYRNEYLRVASFMCQREKLAYLYNF